MTIMHEIVAGKKEVLNSLGLDKHIALERGLDLIGILSFVFPLHFCDAEILNMMVQLLEFVGDNGQPKVLTALTYVGKAKPMGNSFILIHICILIYYYYYYLL